MTPDTLEGRKATNKNRPGHMTTGVCAHFDWKHAPRLSEAFRSRKHLHTPFVHHAAPELRLCLTRRSDWVTISGCTQEVLNGCITCGRPGNFECTFWRQRLGRHFSACVAERVARPSRSRAAPTMKRRLSEGFSLKADAAAGLDDNDDEAEKQQLRKATVAENAFAVPKKLPPGVTSRVCCTFERLTRSGISSWKPAQAHES